MTHRRNAGGVRTVLAWILSGCVLLLLGLYLTGVFEERIPSDAPRGPGRARPGGETFTVAAVEEDVIERAPGTLHAIRETVVTARLVADVREVLVRAGSRVAEGDVLVLLDDRDLQALLQQTQEELTGARARLREAESNHERMQEAAAKNAVSESALEQADAARLSASASVAGLEQRLEQARVDLSHATIRAPFDAVVVDRYVFPGDLASPSRPLLRLYDPERMRLEAHVRETLAIGLGVGDRVTVELATLGARLEGTVEEVVPQAEAASRSLLVKVGLPPTEKLYPGMFGRLLLRSGRTERLRVPAAAITRVGQLNYVTLVDGTRRLVVPGAPDAAGRVELLSGVEAGLELVVAR